MELLNFNMKELEQLETLLQLSTEISNIYDQLCKLEINNQKDSKEYNQLITKLNKLIEKENNEYNSKNFTQEECIKYLKLLEIQTKIPAMDNKITTSLKYYDKRIVRRIIINLIGILDRNKEFHKKMISENILKSLNNIVGNITENDLVQGINKSAQVQTAINNDIHSIFLSILEESISSKSNKDYRSKLIEAKYCILFSHKNMESLFIGIKFDIPSTIYTSSKMINQTLNQSDIAYNHIKYIILKSLVKKEINILLNFYDSEYNNDNVYFSSIICQCHIRAILSLMEENEVNNLNQEFHNIIEGQHYLSKHLNDRISESIIMSCFKCFKHDKIKIRTLSAKPQE